MRLVTIFCHQLFESNHLYVSIWIELVKIFDFGSCMQRQMKRVKNQDNLHAAGEQKWYY